MTGFENPRDQINFLDRRSAAFSATPRLCRRFASKRPPGDFADLPNRIVFPKANCGFKREKLR